MTETVYTVHDSISGAKVPLTDTDRAERLSHAGFKVTARMH